MHKAIRLSIIKEASYTKKKSLENYEPLTDKDFYIVWYESGSLDYTENAEHITESGNFSDVMTFSASDSVKENKWILYWRLTKNKQPDKRGKLGWMYIDEVIENGVNDGEFGYTTLTITRTDRENLEPPFEIDNKITEEFKKLISLDKYKPFIHSTDKKCFLVKNTFGLFKDFISDLKKSIKA